MTKRRFVLIFCMLGAAMAAFHPAQQAQTIWYVDDNAPGDPGPGDTAVSDPDEDGSAAHPFDAIQEGINAASGADVVLVTDGTYNGEGNKNLVFSGKSITVKSENGPFRSIIDCEGSGRGFSLRSGESADTVVQGFTIRNGFMSSGGAIIIASNSSPTISGNVITDNTADYGGGIYCEQSSGARIMDNLFKNNAASLGAGILCYTASPNIAGNTIAGNAAGTGGGGVYCYANANPVLTNNIIWDNTPDGIAVSTSTPAVTYSDVQGGFAGTGNISLDPAFTSASLGSFYLSQIASGQASDSPCMDAGDPVSGMVEGTTRTDQVQDAGTVDMGYHYPIMTMSSESRLVTGAGPGQLNPPSVRVFPPAQDAVHEDEFSAYGTPHYGVRVHCGDVTGDGLDEILTGPGPGAVFGPHVRGFQVDGTPVPGLSFFAYGTKKFGANVTAGDIDKDGYDEIITGAGPGAVFGPHVRAFDYDDSGQTPIPISNCSFFAYGTRKWGVNLSAGDVDGDGFDEILTGPGPGAVFAPHVRGWNVDGQAVQPLAGLSYFAYGTTKFGVVVSCGDLDSDGRGEILTAPGPSVNFGPSIRGWNYDAGAVAMLPNCNFSAAWQGAAKYGASVYGRTDLDLDMRDDIVVGVGPDPGYPAWVKVFQYGGSGVTTWFSLTAYPSTWYHGVNVAGGAF